MGFAAYLDTSPALGQPHPIAVCDQLERQQHRDHLRNVRYATGGQWKGRNPQQEDEQDRETTRLEEVDEASERLVGVASQPLLELVAEPRRARRFGAYAERAGPRWCAPAGHWPTRT
jgi:hypothetical protein